MNVRVVVKDANGCSATVNAETKDDRRKGALTTQQLMLGFLGSQVDAVSWSRFNLTAV